MPQRIPYISENLDCKWAHLFFFHLFSNSDEDMQSVVSLMSVNNNCDVAPLDDLEDIPDLESTGDISDHLYDFTQQLEMMTTSLNGCIDLPTPLSGMYSFLHFNCQLKLVFLDV